MEQKKYHDRHAHDCHYDVGQSILIGNLRDRPNWLVDQVITKLGPVTYEREVQGQLWRCRTDQLMSYKGHQIPNLEESWTSYTREPSLPHGEDALVVPEMAAITETAPG